MGLTLKPLSRLELSLRRGHKGQKENGVGSIPRFPSGAAKSHSPLGGHKLIKSLCASSRKRKLKNPFR